MTEQGDKARKALHDMRWGPHIEDVIERQEKMDDAIKVALQTITVLEADADALLAVVKTSEEYIQMLEYCAGGMIAEFGAKHAHSVTGAYNEAIAALPEHLKGES